jgi:glycosyltransferase involved in cell wall biosynthesis
MPSVNQPLLSICIPTRNRVEALQSLMTQAALEIDRFKLPVQIVVSDNASQDGTEALCESLCKEFHFIRYHRNPSDIGGINNFWRVVEVAQSEFCWLLGDDTLIPFGTIRDLVTYLNNNSRLDLLLLVGENLTGNTPNYLTQLCETPFDIVRIPEKWKLLEQTGLQTLGYISILLFRRSRWLESSYKQQPDFYIYPQIAAILDICEISDEIHAAGRLCCKSYNAKPNHAAWYRHNGSLSVTIELPAYQARGRRLGIIEKYPRGYHANMAWWRRRQVCKMMLEHPEYIKYYRQVIQAEPLWYNRLFARAAFMAAPISSRMHRRLTRSRVPKVHANQ